MAAVARVPCRRVWPWTLGYKSGLEAGWRASPATIDDLQSRTSKVTLTLSINILSVTFSGKDTPRNTAGHQDSPRLPPPC